ncbi:hypothetical protein HJFPF1_10741 [Paramyrothecium foliicola]|nr:hypothetical protein HJFPF1_10741 [Paramyrothecium foliicola]
MDETGVMLSKLNSVKVLVSRDNQQGYRGARVKRTTVTAIECGYTDSYLSLQWLKLVFDPQTRETANQKTRVLICDGFGTHETLEILEFCFENKIILCRNLILPINFNPRDQALTSRNIRAGWAKAGLFPFNPDRVLCDVSKPPTDLIALQASEVNVVSCLQDHVPQTPVTPVSAEAVASLHKLIEQDLYMLDEMNRPRLEKHLQKLTHAAQLSFAERSLLQENNQFLAQMNNEAKVRRSTKSEILGTARVMSYEDLENARAMRASKEAAKEAKKAAKDAKRVTHSLKLKQAPLGKKNRGRKTKNQ